MSKIKIAELFYSIQGEGRFMGVPSVFLRTFGCNFTCGGFGMAPGEMSLEADAIAIKHTNNRFTEYGQLPLVSTGCDSYASWHPSFKDLSPVLTSDAIAERIMEIIPHGHWEDEHLVITGGEPLLGWQRAYPDLLNHPKMQGLKEITFETNGTQALTPEFATYLEGWTLDRSWDALTFSVSVKLSCSGETREDALKPEVVAMYENYGYTYLKLVVATEADAQEAIETAKIYRAAGFEGPVYLMPIGGVESVYSMNNRRVAELAMKHGLRYSDRLQVPLFKNEWGT